MNKIATLLIICIYIAKSNAQCENDKHYTHYHTLIGTEKGNIQKVFDTILEKYGDVDKILEDLLNKLKRYVTRADSGLNQLEKYNRDIKENNGDSIAKIEALLKNIKAIRDELEKIKFDETWPVEQEDAEKIANKIVILPAQDIPELEEVLTEWKSFLEQLKIPNYAKDIMTIPHSVSDELNLLEKLVTEGPDTSCFDKFHNDLKLLFLKLANLFDLSSFKDDIDNLRNKTNHNKQDAEDIFSDTENFLKKEKELENIFHLTNETLALAEEIEKLKKMINDISQHNEGLISDRLKKLQEEHQADIEKLNEKYNVNESQLLLNELREATEQIKNINIADVELDIDNYSRELNYYICILEQCEKLGNRTQPYCDKIKNTI